MDIKPIFHGFFFFSYSYSLFVWLCIIEPEDTVGQPLNVSAGTKLRRYTRFPEDVGSGTATDCVSNTLETLHIPSYFILPPTIRFREDPPHFEDEEMEGHAQQVYELEYELGCISFSIQVTTPHFAWFSPSSHLFQDNYSELYSSLHSQNCSGLDERLHHPLGCCWFQVRSSQDSGDLGLRDS